MKDRISMGTIAMGLVVVLAIDVIGVILVRLLQPEQDIPTLARFGELLAVGLVGFLGGQIAPLRGSRTDTPTADPVTDKAAVPVLTGGPVNAVRSGAATLPQNQADHPLREMFP